MENTKQILYWITAMMYSSSTHCHVRMKGSVYARNTIIERVTRIKGKGKHRLQSESGSGTIGKNALFWMFM